MGRQFDETLNTDGDGRLTSAEVEDGKWVQHIGGDSAAITHVVSGQQIRSGGFTSFPVPNAHKYKKFFFIYRSTLNVPVRFRLIGETSSYYEVFNGQEYEVDLAVLRSSGDRKRLLNTEKPFLNDLLANSLTVVIHANPAPSSGALWVEVIGLLK